MVGVVISEPFFREIAKRFDLKELEIKIVLALYYGNRPATFIGIHAMLRKNHKDRTVALTDDIENLAKRGLLASTEGPTKIYYLTRSGTDMVADWTRIFDHLCRTVTDYFPD